MTSSSSTAGEVGVLALQGDFREHRLVLESLGVAVREVRTPAHLDQVGALVIPGGESTAMSKLLESSGLYVAIEARLARNDLPLMGTCAGLILAAREVKDAIDGQRCFGIFNAVVRRNGIGPQAASCEASLDVKGFDTPIDGVFIRPPVVETVGDDVDVLATWRDGPVLCAQGRHVFATFHPELTGDGRVHQLFLERHS